MKQKFAGFLRASSIAIMSLAVLTPSVYIFSPDAALANPGKGGGNAGGNGPGNGGGNGGGHSLSGTSDSTAGSNSTSSQSGHSGQSAKSENGSKIGGSNQGSIHSELKGLNAAHASLTALNNAAPNSQVGRIATYRNAALATDAQATTLAASVKAYNDYVGSYTGPTAAELQTQIDAANGANAAVQGQIDALDPTSSTYAADKANLEAQMTDTTSLTSDLQQAQTYEANLSTLQQAVTTDQTTYNTDLATEQQSLSTASGGRTLSEPALAELRSELGL